MRSTFSPRSKQTEKLAISTASAGACRGLDFDDELRIKAWILERNTLAPPVAPGYRIPARIADDPRTPYPVVPAMMHMTVNPGLRLMGKDQGFKIAGKGPVGCVPEQLAPEALRVRRMMGDN